MKITQKYISDLLDTQKIYFKKGKAKLELGLASGKKNYDKRQDLAERSAKREVDRALKERQRSY